MQLYKNFTPLVSIILPTFNRAKYLNRCIDSVKQQTFNKWELIIIDDGSSDETFEIVNNYLMEDERINYFKQKNRGLPLALNSGINNSTGEYITFLGSDDEYKIDHIEKRVLVIENNNKIDCLFGGLEIIGNPFVKDKNDSSKLIHINDCVVGGTFFGKHEMFIELNGFTNINYSEDSEFYERAKEKFTFKKVDFPTYIYYRDTPDSICNNV